jgi:hypothetical protein
VFSNIHTLVVIARIQWSVNKLAVCHVKFQVRHEARNKKGRRDDGPLEQQTGSKG